MWLKQNCLMVQKIKRTSKNAAIGCAYYFHSSLLKHICFYDVPSEPLVVALHVGWPRFQSPGNFCEWNLDILSFGIHNSAEGIGNPANDWNPESKFH